MSSIAAFPVPGSGHVRIEVDWSDIYGPPRKAWVYRVVNGVATAIRGADPGWLSGGQAIFYDVECPLDTAVTYQTSIALNAYGDMEDDALPWADTGADGTVGSVALSYDYYAPGTGRASLKLTPSGAALSRAVSEFVAATAGVTYEFTGKLMVPTAWAGGIGIQAHFYQNVTLIGTAGAVTDVWPNPGEWQSYSFTAVAPATTSAVRIVASIAGTPPSTQILYADDLYITRSGVTTISTGSVTLNSEGTGWWKDPLHPATMVRLRAELEGSACDLSGVVYGGLGDFAYAADSSLQDVTDGEYPVSTWATRKAGQSRMLVGTASLDDLAAVRALHAPGAPLLLQVPSVYGIPDHYQQHGDLAVGYLGPDQRKPWRRIASGFAQVLAPVGPAEGVFGVRYEDINRWATYDEAESGGFGARDNFQRNVAAGGWGVATSGQTWGTFGTATNMSVNGNTGLIQVTGVSVGHGTTLAVGLAEVSLYVDRLSIQAAPTGAGNAVIELSLRHTGADFVSFRVFRSAAGGATTAIRQVVGGVETFLGFPAVPGVTNSDEISVRFEAVGTTIRGKAWKRGTVEPAAWNQTLVVTHVAAGSLRIGFVVEAGITNAMPYAAGFDGLMLTDLVNAPRWWDILQGEGHV